VQRDHRWGRKEPKDAFNAACDRAIDALQGMKHKETRTHEDQD